MSQLGEFIATIQNNQDVRTAELEARLAQLEGKEECGCAETITALEERLATLESKEECGCAETITALEERLATLESKEECGCAETITALEERLATLESKEECGCAETITALEERLATLESKEECGCGSYDELLASYEERISALEGNTGGSTEGEGEGGSTEGEGGSTEGEGEGGSTEGEGGSTEPMTASQALAKYNHLIGFFYNGFDNANHATFMSVNDHKYAKGDSRSYIADPFSSNTVAALLNANKGDIVKVYTPDLQEIEIIADSTSPYFVCLGNAMDFYAFGNVATKEVYCYYIDSDNMTVSPCTNETFIAKWGNSDALGL
jgi:hypothetical protein